MNGQVFIIGDVHGKIGSYINEIHRLMVQHGPDVKTIQLGDMGFRHNYTALAEQFIDYDIDPANHLFFPGNHDEYPALFFAPNVIKEPFGPLPFIENAFFISGAACVPWDAERRIWGIDMWEEEEISPAEGEQAFDDYVNMKPHYMVTHTCPDVITEEMGFVPVYKSRTGQLLDRCIEAHSPAVWVYGHMHQSFETVHEGTTFVCLPELQIMELNGI